MNLEERENELFDRWTNDTADGKVFAKDGVANENLFSRAKYKILFLAKETNNTDKKWDSRRYLREGVFYEATQYKKDKFNKKGKKIKEHIGGNPITKTFNNIYRWSNFFLNDIDNYNEYKKVPNHKINKELELGSPRIKMFSQIGMMNLKKTAGKHTTKNDEFEEYIEKNIGYINEQVNLYKPNIIICCGKGVYNGYKKAIGEVLYEKKFKQFRTSIFKGTDYETIVIEFCHPQVRGKEAKLQNHFGLLKIIKDAYSL